MEVMWYTIGRSMNTSTYPAPQWLLIITSLLMFMIGIFFLIKGIIFIKHEDMTNGVFFVFVFLMLSIIGVLLMTYMQ